MIDDSQQRALAVNPRASYTVTAPAGSGKTELLSQRFLALLSIVDKPEQILAITFTRKAVAEMRERIMSALNDAQRFSEDHVDTLAVHRRDTLRLAKNALQRDHEMSWFLLQNPSRLRVYTFDAFSASIVRQLPLASRFGGSPIQTDDAASYYERAAQRVVMQSANGSELADSVNTLLMHLDCKVDRLHALLSDTLAKRDQWRAIFSRFNSSDPNTESFSQLEEFLYSRIQYQISDCATLLQPVSSPLCTLINFANENLAGQENGLPDACMTELPCANVDQLQKWQAIADFLLTSSGQFRARVDKRHGFPAKSTKPKYSIDDFKALVTSIQASAPNAHEQLQELLWLPAMNDLRANQHLIEALLNVMRHAMAYLELEFQARQEVDFVATSVQALHALQEAGEVALRLDHQVKHVLVDEFQDTSQVQYDLLQSLCADWGSGDEDGRSLFLVGDAMQSIYAFRNARVALFMHARQYGLASVPLQALTLNSNFRSHPAIINWVNHCFSKVFPAVDDLVSGASGFVESISQGVDTAESGVHAFEYELVDGARDDEAVHICEQIARLKESDPHSSIAILVRSRRQAEILYPYLRQAGIAWQATEFELLTNQPIVADLLSLTEICVNPSNTIAWYALLRSPLIGLSLSDVLLIAQSRSVSGIAAITTVFQHPSLSEEAGVRLGFLAEQYQNYERNRERKPVHVAVRGLWSALGGNEFYADQSAINVSDRFFEELSAKTVGSSRVHWSKIRSAMQRLYADLAVQDSNPVQLMTMHKAKGLEFDTVVLPSLDKAGRPDDTELLNWLDSVDDNGDPSLLMGMYQPGPQSTSSSYSYIREKKKRRGLQENARLLYVACTRAVERMFIYRGYNVSKDQPKASSASSLASIVWPHLPKKPIDISGYQATQATSTEYRDTECRRLPLAAIERISKGFISGDSVSDSKQAIVNTGRQTLSVDNSHPPDHDSTHLIERAIGTVVHRELKEWLIQSKAVVLARNSELRQLSWRTQLEQLGIRRPYGGAAETIVSIIESVEQDSNNAWLFEQSLKDDAGELSLRVKGDVGMQSICLDRTFVDSDGLRWIIDYKVHLNRDAESGELEKLAHTHKPQLLLYQSAFDQPCCLAIYFLYQQTLIVLD